MDKSYQYWGGSFGEVFSIGADAILLEEYETLSGLSFSFGIGAGIDWVHGYTTTNQTIFKSNDNPTSNSKIISKVILTINQIQLIKIPTK